MNEPPAVPRDPGEAGERRPPGGSWGRLYALVVAGLAVEILLLWWFTERWR